MVQTEYLYTVEMSYVSSSDNTETSIMKESISYILVVHDFENAIMPYICMKVKLDAGIYANMTSDQGNGKVNLNIKRYNKSGTSNRIDSYINDLFDYIMTDNPDQTSELDKAATGQGQSFKVCIIGFYKKDILAQNQKQFNGIFKSTNTMSLVQAATADMKIVIEPFVNNVNVDEITVPPIDSVAKYLIYLNERYNFYGDQFTFFMDFDKVYLKSNSGKYIDAKDGQQPYVAIDIRDMTEYKSALNGMVVDDKQKAYILYVDKTDASISTDRITPRTAGNIYTIDSNGNVTQATVDTSSASETKTDTNSAIYVASDDPNSANYISNILKNNTVTVVISKTDMDTSVFTPNKEYLMSNYEGKTQYTGRYYLVKKTDLIENTGAQFTDLTSLSLRMVVHYATDTVAVIKESKKYVTSPLYGDEDSDDDATTDEENSDFNDI